jgi:hypothetical protein
VLSRQRQTIAISLLAARADGLTVQPRSGQARVVPLTELRAVAAGYVPMRDLRRVLVVFLVLDWGAPGRPGLLLRLDSDTGGVEKLRPGVAPATAWREFLSWVVPRSGALPLPDAERLERGDLPVGADAEALELALFTAK